MTYNDFFNDGDDNDRTVIKPMPGGNRRNSGVQPETPSFPPRGHPAPPPSFASPQQLGGGHQQGYSSPSGLNDGFAPNLGANINPLIQPASNLFLLAFQLARSASHSNVPGLKADIVRDITSFEEQAKAAGMLPEHVLSCRYALCSLLDEIILNTPWGSSSIWSQESLLVTLHGEAWGGEKFFSILQRVCQDPGPNLFLIEFFYLCISMGFAGKYRVQQGGMAELELLRGDVYGLIKRQRGKFEEDLSLQWQSQVNNNNSLRSRIPLWVIGVVTASLLIAGFVGFSYAVNQHSNVVFNQVYKMGRDMPPPFVRQKRQPIAEPDFDYQQLLEIFEPEISAGILEVLDDADATIIRIHNKGLFGSGSDRITASYRPALEKISDFLGNISNMITVVGHSDSTPIVSARFPSNWHLSKARAEAVAVLLAQNPELEGRLDTEGRADNEPLVPNDTAKNRAANRRVEIWIYL